MHVLPYGSFISKLYTPNGDLDIPLEGCVRSGCEGAAHACRGCSSKLYQRYLVPCRILVEGLSSCLPAHKLARAGPAVGMFVTTWRYRRCSCACRELRRSTAACLTPVHRSFSQALIGARVPHRSGVGQQADALHKEKKAILLRALCRKLERRNLVAGKIERILSARVPIIKFVERSSGLGHENCLHQNLVQAPALRDRQHGFTSECLSAGSCMAGCCLCSL